MDLLAVTPPLFITTPPPFFTTPPTVPGIQVTPPSPLPQLPRHLMAAAPHQGVGFRGSVFSSQWSRTFGVDGGDDGDGTGDGGEDPGRTLSEVRVTRAAYHVGQRVSSPLLEVALRRLPDVHDVVIVAGEEVTRDKALRALLMNLNGGDTNDRRETLQGMARVIAFDASVYRGTTPTIPIIFLSSLATHHPPTFFDYYFFRPPFPPVLVGFDKPIDPNAMRAPHAQRLARELARGLQRIDMSELLLLVGGLRAAMMASRRSAIDHLTHTEAMALRLEAMRKTGGHSFDEIWDYLAKARRAIMSRQSGTFAAVTVPHLSLVEASSPSR